MRNSVNKMIKKIKQVIEERLRAIYPRGLTASGISATCLRNKTGADSQPLIGFGDGVKITQALDELVEEDIIISNDKYGEPVFHYKTDVGHPVYPPDEIKLAILECLCKIYPKELVCTGIERECFKDKYGNLLNGANGLPLVGLGDGVKIQRVLDDLVAEGKINAYEKELNGEQIVHYRAKISNSARPTGRL